ncbi:MAG: hypothetical protein ACK55Z_35120, partial [bacterium]
NLSTTMMTCSTMGNDLSLITCDTPSASAAGAAAGASTIRAHAASEDAKSNVHILCASLRAAARLDIDMLVFCRRNSHKSAQ